MTVELIRPVFPSSSGEKTERKLDIGQEKEGRIQDVRNINVSRTQSTGGSEGLTDTQIDRSIDRETRRKLVCRLIKTYKSIVLCT